MSEQPMLIDPGTDAELQREIARIPAHMRESLLNFIRYGVPVGGFLFAILSNNLASAARVADPENEKALYQYVALLHHHAPAECWGSPTAVRSWIEAGLALRRKQTPDAMRFDEVRRG